MYFMSASLKRFFISDRSQMPKSFRIGLPLASRSLSPAARSWGGGARRAEAGLERGAIFLPSFLDHNFVPAFAGSRSAALAQAAPPARRRGYTHAHPGGESTRKPSTDPAAVRRTCPAPSATHTTAWPWRLSTRSRYANMPCSPYSVNESSGIKHWEGQRGGEGEGGSEQPGDAGLALLRPRGAVAPSPEVLDPESPMLCASTLQTRDPQPRTSTWRT